VTDLTPIAPKLANAIRLLASDKDGEVVAAWRAIIRTLQGIGADIHDIADRIEHSGNGALSEAEMQEIFDAGIKEGIRRVEQKMHQSIGAPQFPAPRDMAAHCYQRIDELRSEWEKEFITNMASWTRTRPLSPKQQGHLEKIYIKLHGRI
jgi:hypothetical protein